MAYAANVRFIPCPTTVNGQKRTRIIRHHPVCATRLIVNKNIEIVTYNLPCWFHHFDFDISCSHVRNLGFPLFVSDYNCSLQLCFKSTRVNSSLIYNFRRPLHACVRTTPPANTISRTRSTVVVSDPRFYDGTEVPNQFMSLTGVRLEIETRSHARTTNVCHISLTFDNKQTCDLRIHTGLFVQRAEIIPLKMLATFFEILTR